MATGGKKTEGVLSWEEYFMSVAMLSGKRSKDPVTQVGACIVNADNRIVGTGYNGMPDGCSDDVMPWGRGPGNILKTKRPYVCHAAMNAIVNKIQANIKECKLYTSLYPCNECAKLIIQSGIKEVIYYSNKHSGEDYSQAARKLFEVAGVKARPYNDQTRSQRTSVVLHFEDINRENTTDSENPRDSEPDGSGELTSETAVID